MNQILESSVVVRALRWLAKDSAVASGVKSVIRFFGYLDQAFARASAAKEAQVDPERVHAILKSSAIVRTIDVLFSAPSAAWEHARVRPVVEDARAAVAAMSLPERVRLLGWMVAVALVTRAGLYVLGGTPLTGGTLAVWGIVLVVSVVMATASRQVAAGWVEWKQRRDKHNGQDAGTR